MKTEELAKKACDETGGYYTSWLTEFASRLFALRDAEAVPVGVFCDVNSLTPEHGERWEHMGDDSYDPEDGYIHLFKHAPAPSDLVEENERLKKEIEQLLDLGSGESFMKLRQQLTEAQSQIDAIPDMLQTVRTQAWADFRQQLKQQEPVAVCDTKNRIRFTGDDESHRYASAPNWLEVGAKLYAAPATDYKPIAARLLGALIKALPCVESDANYWGHNGAEHSEECKIIRDAIAAAKAAGLGEE